MFEFVVENVLKDFAKIWKHGDRCIVFTFAFITFLKNLADPSRFNKGRENTFPGGFIDDIC